MRWTHPAIPYLATTIATMWVTRPFWWPGRYVVSFDGYAYAGPNLAVSEAALRDGRLPLWNDAIFGGVTHLGNPNVGVLYLPRLLILFLENNRALDILAALHVLVLGLGMVALSRRLGTSTLASGFVGVIAVSSGVVLTKSVQSEQIMVLAWTPWLLVGIHATLVGRRTWLCVAATGAATAAVLLAGHPQMVYETLALAIAATIGFALQDRRWRRLPYLAAAVALGVGMALPQLLATYGATANSVITGGRDRSTLLTPALSLHPGAAARAIFGAVGSRGPGNFVGSFEAVAYVGVVVTVLAVVGLVGAVADPVRRPWALAFGGCAAIAMIWSFGPRTFVFDVANGAIPGFDLARVSARWLVVVALIGILFAGAALDDLVRVRGRLLLITAVVTVVAIVMVTSIRRLDGGDLSALLSWVGFAAFALIAIWLATIARGRFATVSVAALAAVAVAEVLTMSQHSPPELASRDAPFTSYHAPTTDWLSGRSGYVVAFTDDLRDADYGVPGLRPNANALVGVRSIDGYDGGVQITARWAAALRRLQPEPIIELPLRNSVPAPLPTAALGRLGVRYVLIDRTRPIEALVPGWIGPQAADDRFEVWENPDWVGEAIAWSDTEVLPPDEAPDALRDSGDELAATALVSEPVDVTCVLTADACQPIGLEVDRRTPEHLVVTADVDHPTVVTVDQQYDAGWHVEIDGAPAKVLEVDGLIMGVEVPAGRHELSWHYRPGWLTPALVVAVAATLATMLAAIAGTLRRSPRTGSDAPDRQTEP